VWWGIRKAGEFEALRLPHLFKRRHSWRGIIQGIGRGWLVSLNWTPHSIEGGKKWGAGGGEECNYLALKMHPSICIKKETGKFFKNSGTECKK
jgi:hypothetical protein